MLRIPFFLVALVVPVALAAECPDSAALAYGIALSLIHI